MKLNIQIPTTETADDDFILTGRKPFQFPSPRMSKGLFGGEASPKLSRNKKSKSNSDPNSESLSVAPPVVIPTVRKKVPEPPVQQELMILSPRSVVDTYSSIVEHRNNLKANPKFNHQLNHFRSFVEEEKKEKIKMIRELSQMNTVLDSCYHTLDSFTSPETKNPKKVQLDKLVFEKSPLHEHEDFLQARQVKQAVKMEKEEGSKVVKEYAHDLEYKTLKVICQLRKADPEFKKHNFETDTIPSYTPRKIHNAFPTSPRLRSLSLPTPRKVVAFRSETKLPPLSPATSRPSTKQCSK